MRAAEPIRRAPAAEPLVVVGSRSHRGDSLDAVLARLGPHELRPMGSSLKFCLVAEGAADFYPRLGPTSEWDTAAAQAVLEAAGGAVTTLDGTPLRYNEREDAAEPALPGLRRRQPPLVGTVLRRGTHLETAGRCWSRCSRWRWFWHDSLGAREPANEAALEACQATGAALLDGTVAFRRSRPCAARAARPDCGGPTCSTTRATARPGSRASSS